MTTTPDSAAQGGVTQADREAAAKLIGRIGLSWSGDMIRAGKSDDHDYVQAFRRHRLASSPPAQQAGVKDALREALSKIADLGSCARSKTPAYKLFQEAIDIAAGTL